VISAAPAPPPPRPEPLATPREAEEKDMTLAVKEVAKPEPFSAERQEIKRTAYETEVFRQALDVMSEGVGTSDILDEIKDNPLKVAFTGSSFALSAGFLSWALRGASLLASVAASLPAWQSFDPLPVLAAKRRKKRDEEEEKKRDDWQEKRVQRLLNPMDSTDGE